MVPVDKCAELDKGADIDVSRKLRFGHAGHTM
jgi:hypothetical protein